MRWDKTSVRNGMFVMGTQGERIGKVIRCDDETFVVEKGVFFPKDYELRYDHITDVSGGTIRYALTDFLRGRDVGDGRFETCAATARERPRRRDGRRDRSGGDRAGEAGGRPPNGTRSASRSMREEIGIEKVARESGHVRIHKTVHTEEKHFSVPVTREESSSNTSRSAATPR